MKTDFCLTTTLLRYAVLDHTPDAGASRVTFLRDVAEAQRARNQAGNQLSEAMRMN
jgi:hypothetical protein